MRERVEAILEKMTLAEKIGQMTQIADCQGTIPDDLKEKLRDGRVGSMLNVTNPEISREIQRIAVEESRLGIPLVMARDVIHGFRTIFPIPLAQAATWNPELARECARVAAKEASAAGFQWTFAPMMDIARDPRWGRIAESFGEDPYLASLFAAAIVRGFQGDSLAAPDSIAACAKHFVGYGAAEGGRDYDTANIPEGLLRDVYLAPFRAAVDAGVASMRVAFISTPLRWDRVVLDDGERDTAGSVLDRGDPGAGLDCRPWVAHGVAEFAQVCDRRVDVLDREDHAPELGLYFLTWLHLRRTGEFEDDLLQLRERQLRRRPGPDHLSLDLDAEVVGERLGNGAAVIG